MSHEADMRTFKLALLALPLVALGCRSNPNEMLLERESRMLEDKIYHLQALLDDSTAAREATIRENESLKKQLSDGGRAGAGGEKDYTRPALELPGGGSRVKPRSNAPDVPLEAPTIELPEPSDTPPPSRSAPGNSGAAVDGSPSALIINQQLTSGIDRDGQTGDEGIFLVVEPRDEAGRLVKTPGTVSVVVLDPAEEGPQARVARWDFAVEDFPTHFQSTAFGRGLQYELAWPNQPPKNRDLQLFVRFTSAEGTQLNADTKIVVRAPGDPPRTDAQAKSWSASQSANRAPRQRSAPSSRLKSPRSADQRDAPSRDDNSRDSADDPLREARSGRPVWKPYR
jgi:hypothetical protein